MLALIEGTVVVKETSAKVAVRSEGMAVEMRFIFTREAPLTSSLAVSLNWRDARELADRLLELAEKAEEVSDAP